MTDKLYDETSPFLSEPVLAILVYKTKIAGLQVVADFPVLRKTAEMCSMFKLTKHTFYFEHVIFLWVCAAKFRCSQGPEVGVGFLVVSYRAWVLGTKLGSCLKSPVMFQLYMDTGIWIQDFCLLL